MTRLLILRIGAVVGDVFDYFRPGGVDTYLRPDGTSRYKRQ